MSEGETLVAKCVGDECFLIQFTVITQCFVKAVNEAGAISAWFLISAFLAEIKGHLEVLRDAVI